MPKRQSGKSTSRKGKSSTKKTPPHVDAPEASAPPVAPEDAAEPVDADEPQQLNDEPEGEQPPAVDGPAPRGRRKKSAKKESSPHWRVAETADEPAPAPEPEPIAHLAKCAQCPAGLKFHSSASGHGMTVLEHYGVTVDTTFGIGEGGRPLCPNGHGEMTLSDEQLSAAEAITQVSAQVNGSAVSPTQAQLFEMSQPFNFEGAWMDIEVKNGVVAELARVYEDDAARAKRSRKLLEEAQTLLSRMIETYHERRVKKAREAEARIEMQAAHEEPTSPADETTSTSAAADAPAAPVEAAAESPDVAALDAPPADDIDTGDEVGADVDEMGDSEIEAPL